MNPLAGMTRRLQNLLQAARTSAPVTDSGSVQTAQVQTTNAWIRDAVPVLYHYGYSASPPVGSDVAIGNFAGDGSKGVILATAHQPSRPVGLLPGQVLIYTAEGDQILLSAGQGITITPGNGTLSINGAVQVTGDVTIAGKSFLGHMHGGVQTGSGDTAAPI